MDDGDVRVDRTTDAAADPAIHLDLSGAGAGLAEVTPEGFPSSLSRPEAMADNLPQPPRGFTVDVSDIADEGGVDPAFGTVTWRTLISGDRQPSSGLVAGVAQFGPGGTLLPHRHAQAELYYGLTGDGTVTIEGIPHRIAPGIAVYLPGDAEHGTVAGETGLTFLYSFPVDRFDTVEYRFTVPGDPPAT